MAGAVVAGVASGMEAVSEVAGAWVAWVAWVVVGMVVVVGVVVASEPELNTMATLDMAGVRKWPEGGGRRWPGEGVR